MHSGPAPNPKKRKHPFVWVCTVFGLIASIIALIVFFEHEREKWISDKYLDPAELALRDADYDKAEQFLTAAFNESKNTESRRALKRCELLTATSPHPSDVDWYYLSCGEKTKATLDRVQAYQHVYGADGFALLVKERAMRLTYPLEDLNALHRELLAYPDKKEDPFWLAAMLELEVHLILAEKEDLRSLTPFLQNAIAKITTSDVSELPIVVIHAYVTSVGQLGKEYDDGAIAVLERAATARPKSFVLQLLLAEVKRRRGEFDDAIDICRKARSLTDSTLLFDLVLGHCYSGINDIERAKLHYDRILEVVPSYVPAFTGNVELELDYARNNGDRIHLRAVLPKYKILFSRIPIDNVYYPSALANYANYVDDAVGDDPTQSEVGELLDLYERACEKVVSPRRRTVCSDYIHRFAKAVCDGNLPLERMGDADEVLELGRSLMVSYPHDFRIMGGVFRLLIALRRTQEAESLVEQTASRFDPEIARGFADFLERFKDHPNPCLMLDPANVLKTGMRPAESGG